jgi:ferrochelatase
LRDAGARRVLVLPLYPQYSASTTASTFDAVAAELKTWRWLPELRMVNHNHDDPGYVKAAADGIRDAWRRGGGSGDRLLFSFHGLPKRNLLAGDPYHCECHKTARLIATQLGLSEECWAVSFQSRFGRAEWLQPYTSVLLETWAREGVKRVDVVCPGFSADCLETLEEIAEENRDVFLEAGGESFRYLPALNDTPGHVAALVELIRAHTGGWPEISVGGDSADLAEERNASRARALALGAVS